MILVSQIDPVVLADPLAACALIRAHLLTMAATDYAILTRVNLPRVYDADVIWMQEPNAGLYEEIADCLTVVRRGWGDCDDLVPWRIAELWLSGEDPKAAPKVYQRAEDDLIHTEVRRGDGSVEDPARYLGMGVGA